MNLCEYLYLKGFMDKRYVELVERINEYGIESVLDIFGDDIDVAFSFISKKGLWDFIMWNSIDDDYQDSALRIMMKYNPNKAIKIIFDSMSSVSYDGTDYYCEIRELSDLAEWFKSYGRDTSPYDVARGVLSEDYWVPFYFGRRDMVPMRDVYDNLTKENKAYLRSVIVEKYGNIEIVVEPSDATETIEKIATENENGEYVFKITNENVMDLFSDDDTMNYLFSGDLEEVESDLMNIYTNSYNSAYSNEYYNKVWEELRGSFIDYNAEPIDFKWGKHNYIKLKITNVAPSLFKTYLNDSGCDNILNIGDFMYFIHEGFSCDAWEKLSFSIYDYPDSKNVEEEINDNFSSYF